MLDIISLFQTDNIFFLFKVLLLVLIFVYILFTFVVLNRVQALNRTIYLAAAHASLLLQILTFISFLLAVSLFIATIVIV
ncbi:MAG: DUF5657 family protein [Candidatus Levyibacteriota bacterium]